MVLSLHFFASEVSWAWDVLYLPGGLATFYSAFTARETFLSRSPTRPPHLGLLSSGALILRSQAWQLRRCISDCSTSLGNRLHVNHRRCPAPSPAGRRSFGFTLGLEGLGVSTLGSPVRSCRGSRDPPIVTRVPPNLTRPSRGPAGWGKGGRPAGHGGLHAQVFAAAGGSVRWAGDGPVAMAPVHSDL